MFHIDLSCFFLTFFLKRALCSLFNKTTSFLPPPLCFYFVSFSLIRFHSICLFLFPSLCYFFLSNNFFLLFTFFSIFSFIFFVPNFFLFFSFLLFFYVLLINFLFCYRFLSSSFYFQFFDFFLFLPWSVSIFLISLLSLYFIFFPFFLSLQASLFSIIVFHSYHSLSKYRRNYVQCLSLSLWNHEITSQGGGFRHN